MSKIIIELSNDSTEVYFKSNKPCLYLIANITEDGITINERCNKTVLDLVIRLICLLGNKLECYNK